MLKDDPSCLPRQNLWIVWSVLLQTDFEILKVAIGYEAMLESAKLISATHLAHDRVHIFHDESLFWILPIRYSNDSAFFFSY